MHWLLLADFLSTWGYSQVLALLNLHLLAHGFSLSTIGMANSISFVAGSLLAVPAGLVSDLFGYRTGLTVSFLSLGVAVWLKLLAGSGWLLYAAFGLVGAATAFSSASKTPAIAALISPARLPSALALCRALASVAAALGGLAAASLATLVDGQWMALWVGAGITTLAIIPLLLLPGNSRPVRILLFSPRLVARPSNRTPLLPFVLFSIAGSCVFPFINIALSEKGLSPSGIGLSFAAFQAAAVLAWPLTRWLSHSVTLGLRVSLCGLLLSCAWLFSVGPLGFWWVGWLGWHVWLGVGYSFFFAHFGSKGGNQGSFFGLLSLMQMAASAAGSGLGGIIAEHATAGTYAVAGVLFLSAMFLLEAVRLPLANK